MFLLGGFTLAYTVIKEHHTAERSDAATGRNGMCFLGAAILPGVMSWVLDIFWTGGAVAGSHVYTLFGYRVAFGVAAANGLVALVCAAWLHRRAG